MEQLALLCQVDLCTGCRSCEVACKQEHGLPVGVNWMRVIQAGPERKGSRLTMSFLPRHCLHCGRPPCIPACPLKAITKRADGIVLIDADICDGCLACIEACPLGAPVFNPETGRVEMCNLCVDRIDAGHLPACVHHCLANCLKFGSVNDVAELARRRAAKSSFALLP